MTNTRRTESSLEHEDRANRHSRCARNYGGFETCAEEVAVGLAARGHDVSRVLPARQSPGDPTEYKGVKLSVSGPACWRRSSGHVCRTPPTALLHAIRQDFDVLMIFNAGNGPLCLVPRLAGEAVSLVNVDGLEWKRAKWGRAAKLYYQFGEWCSARACDARCVRLPRHPGVSARSASRPRRRSSLTAGMWRAPSDPVHPSLTYDLEPGEYFFVASRLEPENNAETTVRAFERVRTERSSSLLVAPTGKARSSRNFNGRATSGSGSSGRCIRQGISANCTRIVMRTSTGTKSAAPTRLC